MSGNYNRKDHFYREAKVQGRRSRAYFKLQELNKKFHLLRNGMRVFDLGSWPGGWLELISEKIGPLGIGVGIDLVEIEDFSCKNIKLLTGDVRDQENIERAIEISGGRFDLLLSDMSPKLSGVKTVDRLAAVSLAETALWVAGSTLKSGGNFVIKVFKGNETEEFVKKARPLFNKLVREELKSTRKSSNEFYLAGIGYKGS